MSSSELDQLISKIRKTARKEGINPVTLDKLQELSAFSSDLLTKYIHSNEELTKLILENERKQLREIFYAYENDQANAIDLLFKVSKDIADNFHNLSPALTNQYQDLYPEIYKEHFEQKANFVYDRISFNIQRGIWQDLYRDDVSTELVARRYISRLIDLHNPDNFPPEEFSFSTVFVEMFDNFVKSIATEKGLKYWEEKKKKADFKL
jgi:hypothetical protein